MLVESDVYDVLVYTRETEWDKRSYAVLYTEPPVRRLKRTAAVNFTDVYCETLL